MCNQFLPGELLQRFRIVGIAPVVDEEDEAGAFSEAFWLVPPLSS
jgi:hypothetical protein